MAGTKKPELNKRETRHLDSLGRLGLPIMHRRTLDIQDGGGVTIDVDGELIVIRKARQHCVFCGSSRDVSAYIGKNVCAACRTALAEIVAGWTEAASTAKS